MELGVGHGITETEHRLKMTMLRSGSVLHNCKHQQAGLPVAADGDLPASALSGRLLVAVRGCCVLRDCARDACLQI